MELVCVGGSGAVGVLTRLDSAGNAVTSTRDVLADLVGGRLLGVRGDWRIGQYLVMGNDEAG